MNIPQDAVKLPTERSPRCPFDPPAGLAGLRERPVRRMLFPDGHLGWLVTGHAQVRAVLADPRFSSRHELGHYPLADIGTLRPAPPGTLTAMDAPEHTRFRRLLVGRFTVRRMRQLTDRLVEICGDHLDAMEQHGSPTDLVAAYAQPVPALMICELLGVPYADREAFQRHISVLSGVDTSVEDQYAAYQAMIDYLAGLVVAKRAAPTDDVLSELTASDLTDTELAGVATFLLGAGFDTTMNMLSLGTYALLSHPEQAALLRAEPELAAGTVEELLRYLTIAHTGARYAIADVELDGELVRAGETVAISLAAANRDPDKYSDPDRLDVRRQTSGQLAFGQGIHQCLGQQLARTELRVALPALFARFPDLRLAVPAEEVPLRQGTDIYGVQRLPVAW
ncbi:cytochrome P450 [Fodinicola feengrottensis]|uniref:Cytochrome P450 n=1 Tax=Fodinicola feengrottensis TaxID=435914 RepID=A0ABN2GJ00_9ACTN